MTKQILIILFPVILISTISFSQESKQLVRSITSQYYCPREGLGLMQLSDDLQYIGNLGNNRFVFGYNRNNTNFIYDNGKITQLPLNTLRVNYALRDRESNLWLATEDGVYNCRKLLFESYKLGLAKNDNIWSVMKDRKNNILFSSYGYGLWKADEATGLLRKTGIFYKGKKADLTFGYMGNCMDSTGSVWLNYYDGFDALECGQNGASTDPEGYVWLVAGDCVLKFHPDRLMEEIPQLKPSSPCLSCTSWGMCLTRLTT